MARYVIVLDETCHFWVILLDYLHLCDCHCYVNCSRHDLISFSAHDAIFVF